MADDAARGQVVLFGGCCEGSGDYFGDTWTWNGTEWTHLHPAHAPPRRGWMEMAYDAARGQVVLFGGCCGGPGDSFFGDTWTWDGTDWTHRHPAHSPSPRESSGMAYDAARGQVVLFGGCCEGSGDYSDDTWTWDGTDWTRQTPAHVPLRRASMGLMAYDAARAQVVLFGGLYYRYGDTWTWDGTDWTRSDAHSPPGRIHMGMAYDAARAQVVLFGGRRDHRYGDTWTWDGTDWTKHTPAHSPPARDILAMADDAARGRVVLFGGCCGSTGYFGDTWTWDGTDWTQGQVGSSLWPQSGAPGTVVSVTGWGFAGGETVKLSFLDSTHGRTLVNRVKANPSGGFSTQVTIPLTATPGRQRVKAKGRTSGQIAKQGFTVT